MGAPGAVATTGDVEEVEVLVGFSESVRHLQSGRRIDVRVQLTDNQQELALKLSRVFNVGGSGVLRTHRPAHPLLVPPDLIHAVIMAPAVGDSSSIEFGMEEQGSHRVLAASGISENPHSCDVITRDIFELPRDAIGCGRQNQRRPNFSTRHREMVWSGCLCPFRRSAPR